MKNESESNVDRFDDPRVTAYALGELTLEERTQVEEEFGKEPGFSEEVRAIEEFSNGLRTELSETKGAGLHAAQRGQILIAAKGPVPSPRLHGRPSLGRKVAVAAGVFVIAGTAAWLTLRPSIGEEGLTGYGLNPLEEWASIPPSEREGLRALGYDGDPSSDGGPTAGRSNLEALGYGGSVPPLVPGSSHFSGGSEGPGTEPYDPISESGFRDPTRDPLSTFSIDVDTAAYANVRRFLSQRQLPPPDAVRIEEMVNYFDYDYPAPRGEAPFSVSVDSSSAPWEPSHRLVRIGLMGQALDLGAPRAKNLVFLLDVSGSMKSQAKLPLVQRSLRLLVNELSGEDRVALVVYAGSSGLVLPSTPVSERTTILDAIERLTAGGSTNGGSGIRLAYDTAREHFDLEGVNRVILATDGDFNVGVTDRDDLLDLIEKEAKSGVFLSVLGFGTGNLKDSTMEQLADHGNGNYAYVDSLAEARKVLVREMGATLVTIAKDVKIQVEFNPNLVGAWRLVGYENRVLAARDFNDDEKDAGEIGAGHTVTALYEIVPVGVAQGRVDPLKYQATPERNVDPGQGELLTVKLRYKQPDSDTSELLSVPFTEEGQSFERADRDFRFAASVAAFGLCLRDSEQRGEATLSDVYRWAESAIGEDPYGDRREFLKLVDVASGLSGR